MIYIELWKKWFKFERELMKNMMIIEIEKWDELN